MSVIRSLFSISTSVLLMAGPVLAQDAAVKRAEGGPAVVASSTAAGVRFVAPGEARRVRLEVYAADGSRLFDSGFRAGGVYEWDGRGLADGSYLCVLTAEDIEGGRSRRLSSVTVAAGRAALSQEGEEQLKASYARAISAAGIEPGDAQAASPARQSNAVTVTAHDGTDGQVTSTSGALTFRTGDLFSGQEREQMRVTPDGRVGIGTSAPEDALDVAGTIRARGGIRFDDGTVLTSATQAQPKVFGAVTNGSGETVGALASGSGTANRLARWLDGAGTLGDSAITELNGNVGLGTTNPTSKLDLIGSITFRNTAASGGFRLGDRTADPGNQLVFAAAPSAPYSVFNTFVTGSTLASPRLSQFSAWTSDIDLNSAQAVQFAFRHAPNVGGVIATIPYGGAQAGKISIQANYPDQGTPTQLVADTNGNVGVGTATPQSTLQVNGYVQLALTSGAPPATDCDNAAEHGRMKVDAVGVRIYVCTASGWKSTALQ